MAPKKNAVSAKMVYEARVCPVRFVKKANMFTVTQFDIAGKQTLHWEHTKEAADKKFATLKATIANAAVTV